MTIRVIIATVLLYVSLLPCFSTSMAAQGRIWSEPFEVSDTLHGWFPDIAVAPDKSVHVVWYGGIDKGKSGGFVDLLAYRELRGGRWSPVNNIIAPSVGGYTVRNGIVIGRDGMLHAVLRSGTRIQYSKAPWKQAWSPHSRSTPRTIGDGYYDGLAIDSKGNLHVIWTGSSKDDSKNEDEECANCNELYYRQSSDGGETWSKPINLSEMPGGEDKPQIKIDAQDRIHIFWDHGLDWYAGQGKPLSGLYRRSEDGGRSWSRSTIFSIPNTRIQQLTVGTSPKGQMLAIYRNAETSDVYYQISYDDGVSWKLPSKVPGVFARNFNDPPLDIYSTATDSLGHIHLLMVGFQAANEVGRQAPSLLHLSWNKYAWSSPEVLMQASIYPEWPRIVVSDGNQLHVVWFTREHLFSVADKPATLRVWYSGKTIDAPAVTPLPQMRPSPTSSTKALPNPTALIPMPTATPLPTSIRTAPEIDQKPAWELAGVTVVGGTVLVVAVFLTLLIALIRWRTTRRI